jgi:YegS/Rv2252/BmrU family lipid kinase
MRACLISNPRSGRGGVDLSDAVTVLQAHGWETTIRAKEYGGHAVELAREAAEAGYDLVVGCGGDGTLRQIVDGLVGTDVAIGCLPGGTVNLWARELGISSRLTVAARQLIGAERRRIDVGEVRVNGRHRRHFFLMAGLGIDGAVMARTHKPLKNRIGPLAVGLAAIQAVPAMRPALIEADLGGVRWRGPVAQIVVGNTRLYGGFGTMTPDAFVDDGLLDVCLITAAGPLRAGRQIASLLLRHRPSAVSAEWYRVAALCIQAPHPLPLQLDGGARQLKKIDPDQPAVFSFSVVARGVTMLVPQNYSGTLFVHDPLLDAAIVRPSQESVARTGASQEGDHEAKGALRVIAVGVDDITAVRLKSGRTWSIRLGEHTTLHDGDGDMRPLLPDLARVATGSIIRVEGEKDRERRAIAAHAIHLLHSH